MKGTERSNEARLIADHVLSDEEGEAIFVQALNEEFGERGDKGGSIHRHAFLASHYAGEKRLEKLGHLELFRQTQRLPDYPRAEDALKRGWARFMESDLGIGTDAARDTLKIRQYVLLDAMRRAQPGEARRQVLRCHCKTGARSFQRGDDSFLQTLGLALGNPPRKKHNTFDSPQVFLRYWLTGFWWLMPLQAVAADMARIQGDPENGKLIDRFNYRLRQIKSRQAKGCPGAFYSAGWNGCFYSSHPPLIGSIENDGRPVFTAAGRRLLAV